MPRGPPGTEIVLAREKARALQKMKKSGNEAKNWLKAKDITFLTGAIYVRFACEITRFALQKEQKHQD